MRRASLAAATAALVSACAGSAPQSAGPAAGSDIPPSNYRQLAAGSIRDTFFDPYSIRDAEIAPPKLAMGPSLTADGFVTPWVVCIRANAKNRMGGYTGRKTTAIAIYNGHVVNSWDEAQYSNMVCSGAAYEPFPEIEQAGAVGARKK